MNINPSIRPYKEGLCYNKIEKINNNKEIKKCQKSEFIQLIKMKDTE